MITGLVLVRLQAGKEKQALTKIKEVKGVSHVSAVYGRWDLVVDIEADDLQNMSRMVVEKLRIIPGIFATETLVTTAI
ncbi:MAG: Lrp/AsnC ligand binding domain-containing protein [Elusimicrobia bacterium]|nr:Lrp/AsnC ligand binding domain-containing protein [Candidatus Obscuribacterium magneticum]